MWLSQLQGLGPNLWRQDQALQGLGPKLWSQALQGLGQKLWGQDQAWVQQWERVRTGQAVGNAPDDSDKDDCRCVKPALKLAEEEVWAVQRAAEERRRRRAHPR